MRVSLLEDFVLTSLIAPERPTLQVPGQALIVCVACDNRYNLDIPETVDAAREKTGYWYMWMLDHPMTGPVEWAARHIRAWHN